MSLVQLKKLIKESSNIVFLSGAGVSTESNIPDFRSDKGIYSDKNTQFAPETILSHSFFITNTELFYSFYKNKMIYKDAKPNAAHYALAKLEKMGKLRAVITQNIDGLHQAAGSINVLELHGSVHRNFCMDCGEFYNLDDVINSQETIPYCKKCKGIIKPDVVLYEEPLNSDILERAVGYVSESEILIVGGTSLLVYPAAGLVNYFRGKALVLINKSETPYDSHADYVIHDSIGKVLTELADF